MQRWRALIWPPRLQVVQRDGKSEAVPNQTTVLPEDWRRGPRTQLRGGPLSRPVIATIATVFAFVFAVVFAQPAWAQSTSAPTTSSAATTQVVTGAQGIPALERVSRCVRERKSLVELALPQSHMTALPQSHMTDVRI